jgi:hypothetical protein
MLYARFPLSLRNVEDLLHERGVDISYEFVRYWWHRFGSQFASQSRSVGRGACSPVIGNGNSDRDQMLKLFRLKAPIMEMVESLVGLTEIILEYALLDKTK